MDFDSIFASYYTLYRTEATVPASTDDEYIIALSLANEAIRRWAQYDNTFWKELFTSLSLNGEGETVSAGTTDYDAPDDMKAYGGVIRILDANGNIVRRYRLYEPQDVQFKTQLSQFAYFTGDATNGFTLHLNPAPDTAIDGFTLDYDYYKKPTQFTNGGTEITEMSEPDFVVHRMLANRFRGSRNPYYDSAIRDSEDLLKTMQLTNNSGNWANPWSVADNSGSVFGA